MKCCGARAQEFVEAVARPKCAELASAGANTLKLFAQGVSMGGGVVATLALTRPELLDGIILEAPMLTVSDDIKPPWIIQMLFKVRLPCAGACVGATGWGGRG